MLFCLPSSCNAVVCFNRLLWGSSVPPKFLAASPSLRAPTRGATFGAVGLGRDVRAPAGKPRTPFRRVPCCARLRRCSPLPPPPPLGVPPSPSRGLACLCVPPRQLGRAVGLIRLAASGVRFALCPKQPTSQTFFCAVWASPSALLWKVGRLWRYRTSPKRARTATAILALCALLL